MLSAEVSHDVLAALIGALALILMPMIGFAVVTWRQNRATTARERRVDMVALREQIDRVSGQASEALRVFSQAHERRAAEHEQTMERLEDIAEMLSAIRNGKGSS